MVGNDSQLQILHVGSVSIPTNLGNLLIPNVIYVPSLCKNLISIQSLARDLDQLYHLLDLLSLTPIKSSMSCSKVILVVWHHWLGHPTQPILSQVLSLSSIFVDHCPTTLPFCDACALNKVKLPSFKHHSYTTNFAFKLFHLDLWGPTLTTSTEGYRFYASIVDNCSHFCWFFPLTFKSDFFLVLLTLVK